MTPNFMGSNVGFASPGADQQLEIQRRLKMAEALQGQAMQPIQQSAPIHPFQGLAKMGQAYTGAMQGNKAQELAKALGQQQTDRRGADMSLLAQALQGRQAQPAGMSEDASGNVTPTDSIAGQTPVQSIGQAIPMMSPEMQGMGLQTMVGAQTREDQQQFQRQQSIEARAGRAHERTLAEQSQAERLRQQQTFQADQNRIRAQDQEGLVRMTADLRQDMRPPIAVVGPDGKPKYVPAGEAAGQQPWNPRPGGGQLPTAALKMQNEMLEDVGIAGSINADLGSLGETLASGSLQLGPVQNLISQGRNFAGLSDENSRQFSSFRSTLEKLRNDSLRLNKGVQTEGDAQRAWNELIANINDPQVVGQRIAEIQRINQRAADLKRVQIDTVRSNFGLDPYDAQKFANPPAAIGQNAGQPAPQQYAGPERRKAPGMPAGVKVRRVQ